MTRTIVSTDGPVLEKQIQVVCFRQGSIQLSLVDRCFHLFSLNPDPTTILLLFALHSTEAHSQRIGLIVTPEFVQL